MFTPERFVIREVWGWKHFDRRIQHRFLLRSHDRGPDEKQDNENKLNQAKAEGKVASTSVYYGKSHHLIFEYYGQRIDLLDVYRSEIAARLLSHLQACDALMDAADKSGSGQALCPEDEWASFPGDAIDETKT